MTLNNWRSQAVIRKLGMQRWQGPSYRGSPQTFIHPSVPEQILASKHTAFTNSQALIGTLKIMRKIAENTERRLEVVYCGRSDIDRALPSKPLPETAIRL